MVMPNGKPTTADVLPMKQAQAMVSFLKGDGKLRDATLVALCCGYGLRIGDAVSLTWRSILDDDGAVRETVNIKEGKTGKHRLVHTLGFVKDTVTAWAKECAPISLDAPIVPVSKVTGWRIVKHAADSIGMKGNISPHSLRKAFCDFVYLQTHDALLTCRITGHANASHLLRYVGRDTQQVEDVWESMMKASAKM
jgi:integrase/recombinase XerD